MCLIVPCSWVGVAASKPPTILSPDLGSVNYVQQEEQKWMLIIADDEQIQQVWINGTEQLVPARRTVVLQQKLQLKEGKNTYLVKATDSQGQAAERTFVIYYNKDLEQLEALKNANLPPEERPVAWQLAVGAGARLDSNAAHFSDELEPHIPFEDRKASITSTDITLGYRVKPQRTNRTFQLQYTYALESYEDQETNDVDFKDLGLQAHTLVAQYTWQLPRDVWGLAYAISRFDGNANNDDDEELTSDNGDIATFHILIPSYTRVHSTEWTSSVVGKFLHKDFQKEPLDHEEDRDSALSFGADYRLFYYLPAQWGRLRSSLGLYREAAQGKRQRFNQWSLGLNYEKNWQLDSDSEFRASLDSSGRWSGYDEKDRVVSTDPTSDENSTSDSTSSEDEKRRQTIRQTDSLNIAWMYQESFTLQFGYMRIRAFSNIGEFSFNSEVLSINAVWKTLF